MIGLQIQSWYVGMLTSEASRHVSICESHISMTDLSSENNLFIGNHWVFGNQKKNCPKRLWDKIIDFTSAIFYGTFYKYFKSILWLEILQKWAFWFRMSWHFL